MLKVGYIDLGLMGKSMARNILKAGFPLIVHNRSKAAVDELVMEGAQAGDSPASVARQVDVIFTNLPDSVDVEKVALGGKGIIEGAHQGLIHVDNSTIKPASARTIAKDFELALPGAIDAVADNRRFFAAHLGRQLLEIDRRDLDMNIDPIHERP